jgi:serine/threonine protein phosphatase PrpC
MASELNTAATLFLGHAMHSPETVTFTSGELACFTRPCPPSESTNEDACGFLSRNNQSVVLMLADGMGGSSYGGESSTIALQSVKKEIEALGESDTLVRTAIVNAFENANESIRGISGSAGTTLVVVEIDGKSFRPYHVGDSAILVVGGKGKVKYQNVAHSPTGFSIEAGFMEEAEAMQHEERHLISNVLGTAEMYIQIGPKVTLSQRDTVLLASDGLTDNLYLEEIVKCCRVRPLKKAIEMLVELATQRMTQSEEGKPSKPDDLSILLYRPAQ